MAIKKWATPPEMQIDPEKNYQAVVETDKGNIELELYPQYAPKTVNNFVFLAREGFYDKRKPVLHYAFAAASLERQSYGVRKSNCGTGDR